MATKSKRIEVVSPNIKCYGENVSFKQLLEAVNSIKLQMEFKDHEIKLMNSELPNCSVGLVITGQNKDLPPKRNNQTGGISTVKSGCSHRETIFWEYIPI